MERAAEAAGGGSEHTGLASVRSSTPCGGPCFAAAWASAANSRTAFLSVVLLTSRCQQSVLFRFLFVLSSFLPRLVLHFSASCTGLRTVLPLRPPLLVCSPTLASSHCCT